MLEKISGRKVVFTAPQPADPKGKKPQPKPSSTTSGPIGGRIRELLADKRSDQEKIQDLYLIALSRKPTRDETDALLAHIQKKGDAQAAYEDILWVVINTKEFLFNH